MPVIDAHLHMNDREWFDQSALDCGRKNTLAEVTAAMEQGGIDAVVAMSTSDSLDSVPHAGLIDLDGIFPDQSCPQGIYCCVGIRFDDFKANTDRWMEHLRRCVQLPRVVGFKLYPGYEHFYVTDPALEPLYRLAAQTGLPVAIHCGDTVTPGGRVKFTHPLTVDDAAVDHPDVKFVICHMGYPWFADAAEVAYKNANVWVDISGLAGGEIEPEAFLRENKMLMDYLTMWLQVAGWNKVIYGSDWPLVPPEVYLHLMQKIIPVQHHNKVFFENALQVYSRILPNLKA